MLSQRFAFLRVLTALCGSAALLLNGCSGVATPAANNPPTSTLDFYNTAVKVHNDTTKCAWITVYWANSEASPWHIMGGDDARPRFVEPGKSYNFGYLLIAKVPIFGALQIKVLAEIKNGACAGGNIRTPDNYNKDLQPVGADADVCVHVTQSGDNYAVSRPELYQPGTDGCK